MFHNSGFGHPHPKPFNHAAKGRFPSVKQCGVSAEARIPSI